MFILNFYNSTIQCTHLQNILDVYFQKKEEKIQRYFIFLTFPQRKFPDFPKLSKAHTGIIPCIKQLRVGIARQLAFK